MKTYEQELDDYMLSKDTEPDAEDDFGAGYEAATNRYKMPWIPIGERLPTERKEYFCRCELNGKEYFEANFFNPNSGFESHVTHWLDNVPPITK